MNRICFFYLKSLIDMKLIIRVISISFAFYLLYGVIITKEWNWNEETIMGILFSALFIVVTCLWSRDRLMKKL